jgi:hypothetical protein
VLLCSDVTAAAAATSSGRCTATLNSTILLEMLGWITVPYQLPLKFSLRLSFLSRKPDPMISKLLKKVRRNKRKTDHVRHDEASGSVIDHAELDNSDTTSVATGQAVRTSDPVPANQDHSMMSRWKKGSWNATKLTLELVNQGSAMFPPLQTVAALLLNLVNRYEVRYPALSCDSRIYSSKLTSANKDSIRSVAIRAQSMYDFIVQRGSASDPDELKRRKQLDMSVSLISCIFLYYLIFDHPVD